MSKEPNTQLPQSLLEFIKSESFAGVLLVLVSICALIIANSPWQNLYQALIESNLTIGINQHQLSKSLLLWINDGLMAIYFLLIGLELKREFLEGQLSKVSQIVLPGSAALGGIIVPALIYYAFNHSHPVALKGWAIPTATDIAFSLGILALLGARIPNSLKIFLMTIAIFDDFIAILIIAIFYTANLSALSLSLASLAIACLICFNRCKVQALSMYIFVGVLLWLFVLKSGVHATLAGVVLAFMIPNTIKGKSISPLKILEHKLEPWIAYFIIPVFAFANSGIAFNQIGTADFLHPLTLGIACGLFFGKQIGIFGTTFLLVKCKIATLPHRTHWKQIYGVAVLAGVGFTMSLFISSLAFEQLGRDFTLLSRLGIFAGSFASATVGYIILRRYPH